MRKYYLDNIRWVTVVLVVIYHVLDMYNGEGVRGGLVKITALDVQYYDIFMYAVYPWFMLLLFLCGMIIQIISGANSRYKEQQKHKPRIDCIHENVIILHIKSGNLS